LLTQTWMTCALRSKVARMLLGGGKGLLAQAPNAMQSIKRMLRLLMFPLDLISVTLGAFG
jgi:hypothetical protein